MGAIERYLVGLKLRAHNDWLSARLLWNLGFVKQSIWLLQQSMEKYLKVAWASNKTFNSVKDLEARLKNLGKGKFDRMHDLNEIFNKIEVNIRQQLGVPKFIQVKPSALRYNGSFCCYIKNFAAGELFVNKIRKLLNEPIKTSLYDEIKCASIIRPHTAALRQEHNKIIKEILSLKNRVRKKSIYKQIKRKARILLEPMVE